MGCFEKNERRLSPRIYTGSSDGLFSIWHCVRAFFRHLSLQPGHLFFMRQGQGEVPTQNPLSSSTQLAKHWRGVRFEYLGDWRRDIDSSPTFILSYQRQVCNWHFLRGHFPPRHHGLDFLFHHRKERPCNGPGNRLHQFDCFCCRGFL